MGEISAHDDETPEPLTESVERFPLEAASPFDSDAFFKDGLPVIGTPVFYHGESEWWVVDHAKPSDSGRDLVLRRAPRAAPREPLRLAVVERADWDHCCALDTRLAEQMARPVLPVDLVAAELDQMLHNLPDDVHPWPGVLARAHERADALLLLCTAGSVAEAYRALAHAAEFVHYTANDLNDY